MSGDHNQHQKPTGKDSLQVEAMKQALEALAHFSSDESDEGQVAIAAHEELRQAIEQAEKSELLGNSEQLGKEWVGLTVEDKTAIRNSVEYSQFMSAEEYASLVQDATEAKLKEKNYG